tara:strand:- start:369 stop:1040 length:672 start_codon:yes stop_codon:yes gene_type:complete
MAKHYFEYVPNFEYVSRLKDAQNISDYTTVKNLFKRAKIRPDIWTDLSKFTKYKIVGDERPDNVAFKQWKDQKLDWLVMMCNNIINLQDEWPLDQQSFEKFLINKYKNNAGIHSAHHYETQEVKDSTGRIVVPKGLEVPSDYSVSYYDKGTSTEVTASGITDEWTNYQYEERLQDNKRNIYLIKGMYIGMIIDDLQDIMPYRKGSTQYVSRTLVRGENIRLYN